jgi:UDP-N-acetyl-D-mannosaminuronate dehydrogenase
VNSTVTPGTTKELGARAAEKSRDVLVAFSPIRGMPKNDMKKELLRYTKYIAGVSQKAATAAEDHFKSFGMNVKTLDNVTALEWAKIFETTYRAAMIATFQEFHRICHSYRVSLNDAIELIADDNAVLQDKPLHYPGVIGGHCLMPNTDLLLEAYKSSLFRLVKRSNGDRRIEIVDPAIRAEIEQIRLRVEPS